MAIDREAITDKVLRTGELPGYSFVPPGTGSYGEPSYVAWKDLPYEERVAKAKELMAAAGYGPDNPLRTQLRYNTSENHKKIAIAVAAMWKQLGVATELFNTEVKVHYNDLQEANFEVARAGWIADYNDPQNFLYLMETESGVQNYAGYSSAGVRPADGRIRPHDRREAAQRADARGRGGRDGGPAEHPDLLLRVQGPGLAGRPGLGRQHQGHPPHALALGRALTRL